MEITRNFDPRRRLKGAAIAVQTVNYFSKKTLGNSKKLSLQRGHQPFDTKKVVFSDEVLNVSSETSSTRDVHHGSDSKLNYSENMWENVVDSLSSGNFPLRHLSSPEIHCPAEERRHGISELVLNALSEESVLPYQHGLLWSDSKCKPILKTRHSPSSQGKSSHDSCRVNDVNDDIKVKKRKRSCGAKVESKDGTPINRFSVPEITENNSVNFGQFVERDIILKPALIVKEENNVPP